MEDNDLTGWGDDPNNPEYVDTATSKDDDVFAVRHRASEVVNKVKARAKEKVVEYKQRATEHLGAYKQRATDLRRRVITGDKTKRVRDYVMEKPVVTYLDRITFLLSVLCLNATQFILSSRPQWLEPFILAVVPPMLIFRVYTYKKLKWEYFLYDFCYLVNVAAIIGIIFKKRWLQQLVFVYGNGPLAYAIIVWRNNMVFHDFQQGGRRACCLPRNGGVGVRVGPRHDHVLPTCWVLRVAALVRVAH